MSDGEVDSAFAKIIRDSTLTFDPETARAICRQCNAANDALDKITYEAQRLKDAGSAGNFISARDIQRGLVELAEIFIGALGKMRDAMDEMGNAVRQAGLRVTDQDEENARHLASTSDKAKGYPDIGSGSSAAYVSGDPGPPQTPPAGAFTIETVLDQTGAGLVEWGHAAMQPAEVPKVQALADNWRQVTRELYTVMSKFHTETTKLFETRSWTGTAQEAIRSGMSNFVATSDQVTQQAFANAGKIGLWASTVGGTQREFNALKQQKDAADSMAKVSTSLTAYSDLMATNTYLETQARLWMQSTYGPNSFNVATGLGNIPDPQSPVGALVPMALPGQPVGNKGVASVPKTLQSTSTGPSGPGGPGPSGTNSSKSSSPSGSAQLTRAGNADAVAKEAAAKSAAAQQAAAQQAAAAKAGNPASAAQSAASQAAQAGKGLSGLGQGGAATKSASALANAEKAAAERAAKAAAAMGKGGGGGGAGGGMGGAAAAEKALQARAGSMGAAEKMIAAEQAALQNGRAGSPGMNGAPMGGARPGGEGGEGKGHKAARYLNSKANGEEIVGEEQEVAPTVIGGLNLDTTDDRPVRGTSNVRR